MMQGGSVGNGSQLNDGFSIGTYICPDIRTVQYNHAVQCC